MSLTYKDLLLFDPTNWFSKEDIIALSSELESHLHEALMIVIKRSTWTTERPSVNPNAAKGGIVFL